MERMSREEWEEFVPKSVGTVRVNHDSAGCSGGRACMVVTLNSDGWANAYCFRCGGKGAIPPSGHYRRPSTTPVSTKTTTYSGPPDDLCDMWGAFPSEVRRWVMAAKLTEDDAKRWGFSWSDSRGTLWLPIINNGHQLGWEERWFSPKSFRRHMDVPAGRFFPYFQAGRGLVVTEDLLSAIRVFNAGYSSVALLGTEMRDGLFAVLADNYHDRAAIFLDGDNTIVKMKTRKLRNRMGGYTPTAVIETGTDPKHLGITELQEVLDNTFS